MSNSMPDDFPGAALLDALGGYSVVAQRLGLPRQVVHKWRRRGVPARFWPAIERMGNVLLVEVSLLEAMKQRPMYASRRGVQGRDVASRADLMAA